MRRVRLPKKTDTGMIFIKGTRCHEKTFEIRKNYGSTLISVCCHSEQSYRKPGLQNALLLRILGWVVAGIETRCTGSIRRHFGLRKNVDNEMDV